MKALHQEGKDEDAAKALLDYYRARTNVKTPDINLNKVTISKEEQQWADDGLKHTFFVHKGYQLIFFLVHLYQRILFNPVDILMCPFFSIFLVTGYAISLSHRSEPFVTVQLPAELIVFHRPVLPVDVFSVVVRRLITFMYEECMFQSVIWQPSTFSARH